MNWRACLIVFLAWVALPQASGQTPPANVSVTVRDTTGSAIAQVAASLKDKTLERDVTTDSNGLALFQNVPAGTYRISAGGTGFAPGVLSNVAVHAGEALQLTLTLSLAGLTQALDVSAEATKAGVPLAETPQSVSVISRDQLEERGVLSVQEALRYVPSVQAESAGRTGYEEIIIRGFRQPSYQYRDGLRLEDSYNTQQEPFGIEEVEILKGPASVLYGQISPGGLVNAVSKLPSNQRLAEVQLTFGQYGLVSPAFDLNGAFDKNGHWTYRLPGMYRSNDDPIHKVYARRGYVGPAITWQPTASTRLTLLGSYQHDNFLRAPTLRAEGSIRPDINGKLDPWTFLGDPSLGDYHHDQNTFGYLFEQHLGVWTLRSRARRYAYSIGGPVISEGDLATDGRTLARDVVDITAFDKRAYSLDNQGEAVFRTGKFESRALIGIDYLNSRSTDTYYYYSIAPLDIYHPVYGVGKPASLGDPTPEGPFVVKQYHPYGQYRLTYNARWVMVAGLGYGHTTSSVYTQSTIEKASKTVVSGALMYLGEKGWSPYVSYSQSFEPQFGQNPLENGQLAPPTEGEQIEGGVKWRNSSGRLSAAVAAFNIKLDNIVEYFSRPNGPDYTKVAGQSTSTGVETDLTAKLFDSVRFTAGYAYLDARISKSDIGLAGQALRNVPKHAASGYLTFSGETVRLPKAADFGIGVRYQGLRRGPAVADRLPLFVVADASVHYPFKRFIFGLNVKNLFNRRYYSGADYEGVAPGDPITVQVTVRFRL